MPELPEVETIVRSLSAKILEGSLIRSVEIFWPRIVETHSSADFVKAVEGQTVQKISRRGKFIVWELSRGYLLTHLRMTGQFVLQTQYVKQKHEHICLHFEHGISLSYCDARKFGRWYLTDDPKSIWKDMGPEPFSKAFSVDFLKKSLLAHAAQLKPLLLGQKIVAGLGNIYVDEALWEAKLHPQRRSNSLSDQEISALHGAICQVLKRGLANKGTSLGKGEGNYRSLDGERGAHFLALKAYGQKGKPCFRCNHLIQKELVAQRGTCFCPKCQRL